MTDDLTQTPEAIKRAVKEALDDKAIADLGKQMNDLSIQMTDGFARVTTRQDTANGKLMKHETQLAALTKSEDEMSHRTNFWQRNQDKLTWTGISIVVMLFYYLLTHNGFPPFLSK